MRYPLLIEKDSDSDFGVTVPDLPGCFSAGPSVEEAISQAEEAILTHIEGMVLDNEAIPPPSSIQSLRLRCSNREAIWALAEVDLSLLSDKVKRINITLPERLISKIDSFAALEGESRSGVIAHAALEYIAHHKVS